MSLPPSYNLLANLRGDHRIFIETGSYRGDAIALALEAGYTEIHSIEIDPEQHAFCKHRFDLFRNPDPRITLYCGDSAEMLREVLKKINEPATIFLDAHSQFLEGEPEFKNPWPLMKELQQISEHSLSKDLIHTIIVDDILILTHPDVTGWDLKDIIERIRWMNVNYSFQLLANPVKNNLLVASR